MYIYILFFWKNYNFIYIYIFSFLEKLEFEIYIFFSDIYIPEKCQYIYIYYFF